MTTLQEQITQIEADFNDMKEAIELVSGQLYQTQEALDKLECFDHFGDIRLRVKLNASFKVKEIIDGVEAIQTIELKYEDSEEPTSTYGKLILAKLDTHTLKSIAENKLTLVDAGKTRWDFIAEIEEGYNFCSEICFWKKSAQKMKEILGSMTVPHLTHFALNYHNNGNAYTLPNANEFTKQNTQFKDWDDVAIKIWNSTSKEMDKLYYELY